LKPISIADAKIFGRCLIIGLLLLVTACAGQPPVQPSQAPPPVSPPEKEARPTAEPVQAPRSDEKFQQAGMASFYANRLHGRRTASGERYDKNAFTAAHRDLPFGTRVRVVNLKNNRSVEVRINDRGPHRKGRIIDLSHAAARQLGMLKAGVVRVEISLHAGQ
jgi:rare lipoprotein A